MCNADKKKFKKELTTSFKTIKAMTHPVKMTPIKFPTKLSKGLKVYRNHVNHTRRGTVTEDQQKYNKK